MNRYWTAFGLLVVSSLHAAELKPETLKEWERYVQSADASMQARLHAGHPFLWIDEAPGRRRQVQAGQILVAGMGDHNPKKVSSGLIHHWMGAAFFPNAKVDDVLGVIRDYGRYKDYYNPTVIDSHTIRQTPAEDRFSVMLMNKSILLKTALESEYESSYCSAGEHKWYSTATAVHIQEVEDYGQADQKKLPPDEGSGYVWRLHSITRYQEADGGVYVEVEAMALSRDIPVALRWVVDPIVRRVSKGAILTSLRQTLDAVNSSGQVASGRIPVSPSVASGFLESSPRR
jgi:hypothetical protein